MNIEMNNLDEPRLTPPEVVYEHKASLKKTAVIPLYAKIASAAAAVALVLTLCWPRPSETPLDINAAIKTIAAKLSVPGDGKIVTDEILVANMGTFAAKVEEHDAAVGQRKAVRQPNRQSLPLLAAMPSMASTIETEPLKLTPQSTLSELALAWTPVGLIRDEEADLLAQQGLVEKTEVELVEFGEMLRQGWRSVKGEIAQLNESVGEGFRLLKKMPSPPSFHSDSDF